MKKMASLIGIVVSAVAILLGVLILTGSVLDYSGETASYTSFGADFYTYSYRATRYAANNVDELGDLVQSAVGLVMLFAGAAGALLSLYGLGAARESAQKEELLRALLMKQDKLASIAMEAAASAAKEERAEEQAE